jgi:hypothetical protein
MKLITEANAPNFDAINKFFYEEVEVGGVKKRQPRITGIFIQSNVQNRNGRVYPRDLMEKCVQDYVADRFPNQKTRKYRTYGELGHPEGVEINLHRVSHIIDSLEWDGDNVIGSAKIVDTEYGRIAESLLAADGQLGVSSRGVGALGESTGMTDPKMVTEYELIAVDIVSDPSAPDGFVEGILESVDFIRAGGKYTSQSLERSGRAYSGLEKALESLPKGDRNEYLNLCIKDFLKTL